MTDVELLLVRIAVRPGDPTLGRDDVAGMLAAQRVPEDLTMRRVRVRGQAADAHAPDSPQLRAMAEAVFAELVLRRNAEQVFPVALPDAFVGHLLALARRHGRVVRVAAAPAPAPGEGVPPRPPTEALRTARPHAQRRLSGAP